MQSLFMDLDTGDGPMWDLALTSDTDVTAAFGGSQAKPTSDTYLSAWVEWSVTADE